MKKRNIIVMGLVSLMVLTMASGCIFKKAPETENETEVETSETEETEETEKEEEKSESKNTDITAEKIGSIDAEYITTSDGGSYYTDDSGKYGIVSLDGKKDTGAKYAYCTTEENYFVVMSSSPSSPDDIAALNSAGLIDGEGNVIIPEQYASIKVLNERYARVCEVTEKTESEDDALVYYTDKMFSLSASEGDTLYKGIWYVYDITTGEKLEAVTGTKPYNISTYGNYIEYVNDEGEKFCVNPSGEPLPEDADLFYDGTYALVQDNEGAVYDTDDNKLFSYDLEGFVPYESEGEYIIASKYVDSETKYVLMDRNGDIISAEFNDYFTVAGDYLLYEDCVYDFDGNIVVEGTYESITYDEKLENGYVLSNGTEHTIINNSGEVLYKGNETGEMYVDSYNCIVSDKINDKTMCYSYKDGDFTLDGNALIPWIVKITKPNNIYDLVNTLTGETLVAGYESYVYSYSDDHEYYVYARKADGGYDVYLIK